MTDVPSSVQLEVAYIGLETYHFVALEGMKDITVTVKKEMEKPTEVETDDRTTFEVDGVRMTHTQVNKTVKPSDVESIDVEKKDDGSRVVKIKMKK